ncbi:hypothetical protein [Mycobacterium aquaticum]|uniref:hypothetical protein n=1 Tax=Mycobacterium aquaticum TaxID=1927124 RepID=UPI001FE4D7D1|nr:hypothetical protein [Mycobacterium aquaticum]
MIGHHERARGDDVTVCGDDGILGDLQRKFADVPSGKVCGLQDLVRGHEVADLLAELMPGVSLRVGEADAATG